MCNLTRYQKNAVSLLLLLLLFIAVYKGDNLISILWSNTLPLVREAADMSIENCSDNDIANSSTQSNGDSRIQEGELRRQLLIKAKQIFIEDGPKGFHIQNFAEKSKTNPDIIRHLFNNDEGIYGALMMKETGKIGCKSGLQYRIVPSFIVVVFWIVLVYVVQKLSWSTRSESAPVNFLSCIGWSFMLLMLPTALGVILSSGLNLLLLLLPFAIWLSYLFYCSYSYKNMHRKIPHANQSFHKLPFASKLFIIIIIMLFLINLVDILIWDILAKGLPTGDEYSGWQPSITHFRLGGFKDIPSPAPAYKIISNILLFYIPDRYIFGATYAVPFLFGIFLLWIVVAGYGKLEITLPQLFICTLLFPLMFISHDWIHRMLFKMWYGEAMAILIIAGIFLSLNNEDGDDESGVKTQFVSFIKLFGLGLLGAASKPPFRILIVWAFVPGIILTSFLFKNRFCVIKKAIFLGIGAFSGEMLQSSLMGSTVAHDILHEFNRQNLFDWDFTLVLNKLVPYFLSSYEHCWVPFVILVVIAVIMDRKNLSFIMVAIGLVASVIVLYATLWHNKYIDYESGSRYMLHGLYGWMLYFLATKRAFFQKLVFDAVATCYQNTIMYCKNRLTPS